MPNHVIFPYLIAFSLGLFSIPLHAASSLDLIKAAKTPESLRKGLLGIGVPAKIFDSLVDFHDSIPTSSLKRAESFNVDLDGDGKKESVTQIFFEAAQDEYKVGSERLYFILIHGDKAEGKPLDFRYFDLTYCGYSGKGGMNFEFKGSKRKDIIFNQKIFESCGLEIASYRQADTLRFANGKFRYLVGRKKDEGYLNRMDLPDTNDMAPGQ